MEPVVPEPRDGVAGGGVRRPFCLQAYRRRLGDPDRGTREPAAGSLRVADREKNGGVRYRVSFGGGGVLRPVVDTSIGRIRERLEARLRRSGM